MDAKLKPNLEISLDYFFGEKLQIEQPKTGYRAGMDAVILASAAASLCKETICELGCGAGVAIFGALKFAKPGVKYALAIEIGNEYANLCKSNYQRNKLETPFEVLNNDGLLSNPSIEGKFDLVISNPPFFDDDNSIRGPRPDKKSAYIIGSPLLNWLKAMLRLAAPKGEILFIHRADRVDDILAALKGRAGNIRILPIHTQPKKPATRILIIAKKGSNAPTKILLGLELQKDHNKVERIDTAREILNGESLEFWDCLK